MNVRTLGKALNCHRPRLPAASEAEEGTQASLRPAGPGLAGPELQFHQPPSRRQPQATSSPGLCHPELGPDPRSGWRQEAGEWPGCSSPQLDVVVQATELAPCVWGRQVCSPGMARSRTPPRGDRPRSPGCRAGWLKLAMHPGRPAARPWQRRAWAVHLARQVLTATRVTGGGLAARERFMHNLRGPVRPRRPLGFSGCCGVGAPGSQRERKAQAGPLSSGTLFRRLLTGLTASGQCGELGDSAGRRAATGIPSIPEMYMALGDIASSGPEGLIQS